MTIEKLIGAAKEIKNGKCFSLETLTPVEVCAEAKHNGVSILHYAKKQVRSGINYESTKATKQARAEGMQVEPKHYVPIVDRKVQKHPDRDTYYLEVYEFNTTKSEYIIRENGTERIATLDEILPYLTKSAVDRLTKSGRKVWYRIVKADNILRIKQGNIEAVKPPLVFSLLKYRYKIKIKLFYSTQKQVGSG